MKFTSILKTSLFAVMLTASPAFAQDKADQKLSAAEKEKGWKITEQAGEVAQDAANFAEGTYVEIRKAFVNRDSAVSQASFVNYAPKQTAAAIIGTEIENIEQIKIGNVRDIIVDPLGNAKYLIVDDGSVWSFGDKTAVIDYERFVDVSDTGDVYATITEGSVDQAPKYDAATTKGISLAKLLDGEIIGHGGTTLARIENIVMTGHTATDIIVTFDSVFGLGGEKIALGFADRKLAVQDSETDIVLSESQTAALKTFISASN